MEQEESQLRKESNSIKREITLSQAIGFAITILVIVMSNWVSTQVAIKAVEIRQDNFEQTMRDMRNESQRNQDNILNEIKDMTGEVKKVQIEMANKANR